MNESVVEGGEEMNNTEVVGLDGSTCGWRTEIGLFLFLDFDFLLWWLYLRNELEFAFRVFLRLTMVNKNFFYLIMIKPKLNPLIKYLSLYSL